MPCHAMHPIQDLFLESFSYILQFDMHFYMHSNVDKNFILVKSGCYTCLPHCPTMSGGLTLLTSGLVSTHSEWGVVQLGLREGRGT
jgi:hypothetical protein